jgi:molybdate transport system substrate-binding protein
MVAEFAEGGIVRDRVQKGEKFDVVINARNMAEDLARQGLVDGALVDIARTSISVAVRSGRPKPDIASLDAIKRTLSDARAISYSEAGISGLALVGGLEKLGIAVSFKSKAQAAASGTAAVKLLTDGKAEIAVVQTTSMVGVEGIDVVGRLPKEMVGDILVTGGVGSGSGQTAAAADFLKFLASPAALKVIQARGLEAP